MSKEPVAERYAVALFETSLEHDCLEIVGADLSDFQDLLAETTSLEGFVRSFQISSSEKANAFLSIFEGQIHPYAVNTLALMLKNQREDLLDAMCEIFAERVRTYKDVVAVEATTATEMDSGLRKKLIATLQDRLNKSVELDTRVDQSLIGGVQLRINNTFYDGSVKRQLEKLRERLT